MDTLAIIAFAVLMVVLVAAAFLVGLNFENARQRKERHDLKSEVAALRLKLGLTRRDALIFATSGADLEELRQRIRQGVPADQVLRIVL